MGGSEKFLVGVLTGLAIGTALGVMFAPHKGRTTRRRLSQKGEEYFEEMRNSLNEMVDDMADKFAAVKDEAGDLLEKGKKKKKADTIHERARGNGHHTTS